MGMENPFDIAGEPDLIDSVIICVGCCCACVCHVHIREPGSHQEIHSDALEATQNALSTAKQHINAP